MVAASIEAAADTVRRTLFPEFVREGARVRASGNLFVHYTTAETAYRILHNRELWMRSTMTMNDYLEVAHGLSCMQKCFNGESGAAFFKALDECFPNLGREVGVLMTATAQSIFEDTFIACVSEFDPKQDVIGRLSMWRAYGGIAGVALVMRGDVMFAESHALAAYSSPVVYADEARVAEKLLEIAAAVKTNVEDLRLLGREQMRNYTYNMLRFAAVSLKHPGFAEEKEWRVVASPRAQPSTLMTPQIEVVRGVPQQILKIPLKSMPEHSLAGLGLVQLVDHVIVGPCLYPIVVKRALVAALTSAGFSADEANRRVITSSIPLRTW
jgi:Protein of unknown function (DUF2971)